MGAGAHALALSLLLLQAFLRELREVMEPGFSSLSLTWDSCELDSVTTLTPETVMIIVYFFISNIEHFTKHKLPVYSEELFPCLMSLLQ